MVRSSSVLFRRLSCVMSSSFSWLCYGGSGELRPVKLRVCYDELWHGRLTWVVSRFVK